jgi:hypothetical protein
MSGRMLTELRNLHDKIGAAIEAIEALAALAPAPQERAGASPGHTGGDKRFRTHLTGLLDAVGGQPRARLPVPVAATGLTCTGPNRRCRSPSSKGCRIGGRSTSTREYPRIPRGRSSWRPQRLTRDMTDRGLSSADAGVGG